MAAWQEKALREAKQHSSWLLPDAPYEAACRAFLDALLVGDLCKTFLPALIDCVQSLQSAAQSNSLSQTLLRLTSPGVPDLYQGCDLEDLSLVDPDNRRPVDLPARRALLSASHGQNKKQQLIRTALLCRRDHPALFAGGAYLPLEVTGIRQKHVIAFLRHSGGTAALVVALRLPFTLLAAKPQLAQAWGDTHITLPPAYCRAWRNVITGKSVTDEHSELSLAAVLDGEMVALLMP